MAEIINLRRARKDKTRAAAQANAAINRITHGRTRAQREASTAEAERRDRTLNGLRLET
jgi:hypothetical protein